MESLGYVYRFVWESDFDKQIADDATMISYIESLEIVTPLEPRDTFKNGGRTETDILFKETCMDETIDYYDVKSLYPWVNKMGKMPLGHPLIITENFKELHAYKGLMKCKVIPPKGLLHPVLPCKVNVKLLFHLCKKCVETQEQAPCRHTTEERSSEIW